jgi:hypothetical protein
MTASSRPAAEELNRALPTWAIDAILFGLRGQRRPRRPQGLGQVRQHRDERAPTRLD